MLLIIESIDSISRDGPDTPITKAINLSVRYDSTYSFTSADSKNIHENQRCQTLQKLMIFSTQHTLNIISPHKCVPFLVSQISA